VPEKLALAKGNARAASAAAIRAMSCERCLGQEATLPEGNFLCNSQGAAIANKK
jgi:hypothetical protein